MSRTLISNDYVAIKKIRYVQKILKYLRTTTVINGFFSSKGTIYDNYLVTSLKCFVNIEREDIVVFKAVDNSDKYLIKRIIGLPGEVIEIVDSKVYINSESIIEKGNYSFNYLIKKNYSLFSVVNYSNKEFNQLSISERVKLKRQLDFHTKKKHLIFPIFKKDEWTGDNYGRLLIPKKGMKILLNHENIFIYNELLRNFEDENIELLENEIKIFKFKNDYFFVMGDNRHNSIDSRNFGFVPESHIQGKMIKIFSKKRLFY